MLLTLKVFLVNFGILTGAACQYWGGLSHLIIALIAVFFLIFANLMMIFQAKKSRSRPIAA